LQALTRRWHPPPAPQAPRVVGIMAFKLLRAFLFTAKAPSLREASLVNCVGMLPQAVSLLSSSSTGRRSSKVNHVDSSLLGTRMVPEMALLLTGSRFTTSAGESS
jgi:hypothetical protein